MKISCTTLGRNGTLIETRSATIDIDPAIDEFGEFDCWNEAMDAIGWPDGSEVEIVVSLQDGTHIETMRHNSDEGWISYDQSLDQYGLWDYSGDAPRQIAKLGEDVRGKK